MHSKCAFFLLPLMTMGLLSAAEEAYDAAALKQFELRAPLILVEADAWQDSGSIGIMFSDPKGKELSFCLNRTKTSKESRDHIFLGATYFKEDGARLIERGSDTEKAVLVLLNNWLDANWTKSEQETFRKHMDEHKDNPSFKKSELDAMLVLKIIAVLEKRSEK